MSRLPLALVVCCALLFAATPTQADCYYFSLDTTTVPVITPGGIWQPTNFSPQPQNDTQCCNTCCQQGPDGNCSATCSTPSGGPICDPNAKYSAQCLTQTTVDGFPAVTITQSGLRRPSGDHMTSMYHSDTGLACKDCETIIHSHFSFSPNVPMPDCMWNFHQCPSPPPDDPFVNLPGACGATTPHVVVGITDNNKILPLSFSYIQQGPYTNFSYRNAYFTGDGDPSGFYADVSAIVSVLNVFHLDCTARIAKQEAYNGLWADISDDFVDGQLLALTVKFAPGKGARVYVNEHLVLAIPYASLIDMQAPGLGPGVLLMGQRGVVNFTDFSYSVCGASVEK